MRKKATLYLITLFLLGALLPGAAPSVKAEAESAPPSSFLTAGGAEFGLIAADSLWLRLGSALYLSQDGAQHWREITVPSLLPEPSLAVSFPAIDLGFTAQFSQTETSKQLRIFKTEDQGQNWVPVQIGSLEELLQTLPMPIEAVQMQWLSEEFGVLMVREATSRNFSRGTMFTTRDAGKNWQQLPIPAAEKFVFLDEETVLLSDPFNPESFYASKDGGQSWDTLELPALDALSAAAALPDDPGTGNLLLGFLSGNPGLLEQVIKELALPFNPDLEQSNLPTNLTSLQSLQGQVLWAGIAFGDCDAVALNPQESQLRCQSGWSLQKSEDAGVSWKQIILPNGQDKISEEFSFTTMITADEPAKPGDSLPQNTNWVQVFKGHAFDACDIPALLKMQTWYTHSPFRAVNLYIGGNSRACKNEALTAAYVRELYRQGWIFIPTWVGPQAPCTTFRNKFSYDPGEAYQQGVENANQAVAKLRDLNLTNADGTGSVVYYDLEYFTYSTQCSVAARNFVNGWTTRLAQLGTQSGLYATSSNITQNTFWNIAKPPSAVWIAEWYYTPGFRENETVWNLRHLSDGFWLYNQRILQYSGSFNGTWGGVTINIDANVAEGRLAVPSGVDYMPPVSSIALQGTLGYAEWYKSLVNVSLSATDFYTGVRQIYYKVGDGAWLPYNSPFTISKEGVTAVYYRSVDNVGNWEPYKYRIIKIDTTPPGYPTAINPGCKAYNGVPQALCNDASFTWTPPVDAGTGLSPTNTYQYYWGTVWNGTASTSLSSPSFDPGPIPAQTRYYFRIRTQDKQGFWSPWRTIYILHFDPTMTEQTWMPIMYKR